MSDERRKHGWPFWIALVSIVVPIAYVLSIGPACWITSKPAPSEWVASLMTPPPKWMVIYAPIGSALRHYPLLRPMACWWIRFGMKDGMYSGLPMMDGYDCAVGRP